MVRLAALKMFASTVPKAKVVLLPLIPAFPVKPIILPEVQVIVCAVPASATAPAESNIRELMVEVTAVVLAVNLTFALVVAKLFKRYSLLNPAPFKSLKPLVFQLL